MQLSCKLKKYNFLKILLKNWKYPKEQRNLLQPVWNTKKMIDCHRVRHLSTLTWKNLIDICKLWSYWWVGDKRIWESVYRALTISIYTYLLLLDVNMEVILVVVNWVEFRMRNSFVKFDIKLFVGAFWWPVFGQIG